MVIGMRTKQVCETGCGIASDKRLDKHYGISRAFSIFDHHSVGTDSESFPQLSNEINAHQAELAYEQSIERWRHKIAENLRHNMYR
jgi:hypothetical protein